MMFWGASLNVPGLANVQDVNTIGAGLPEVRLHVSLQAVSRVSFVIMKSSLGWRGSAVTNFLEPMWH